MIWKLSKVPFHPMEIWRATQKKVGYSPSFAGSVAFVGVLLLANLLLANQKFTQAFIHGSSRAYWFFLDFRRESIGRSASHMASTAALCFFRAKTILNTPTPREYHCLSSNGKSRISSHRKSSFGILSRSNCTIGLLRWKMDLRGHVLTRFHHRFEGIGNYFQDLSAGLVKDLITVDHTTIWWGFGLKNILNAVLSKLWFSTIFDLNPRNTASTEAYRSFFVVFDLNQWVESHSIVGTPTFN